MPSPLDQAIQDLETKVDTNESQVEKNTAAIETLTQQIANLPTATSGNVDVSDINDQLDEIRKTIAAIPNTPENLLTALTDALSKITINLQLGGVTTGGTSTGGGTPAPTLSFTGMAVGTAADKNVYPLTVPSITDGSDMIIGEGPNKLEIDCASSPGQNPPASFSLIFVRPDGTMQGIAADIPVTSYNGEASPKQRIIVCGPWGNNPKFMMDPSASGDSGLFIGGVALDLAPLGIYGALNSRGYVSVGDPTTYISQNMPATLMAVINQPPVVVPPPPPPPPLTVIQAQINGTAATGTLDQLLAQTPTDGTLTLPAGRIIGAGHMPNKITVLGAGVGQTIIDATNLPLPENKSIFLMMTTGSHFENFSATGARIGDKLGSNGAAFRQEGPGIAYSQKNIEVYGCEDGDLTFAANVEQINCHYHDNGAPGSQRSHNVYFDGDKNTVIDVTDGLYEKCLDVHAFKSRAYTNNITNTVLVAGGNGSCLDIPDGGKLHLKGATLRFLAGTAPDLNILTFGLEDTKAYDAFEVTLEDCIIDDPTSVGLMQCKGGSTVTLVGTNTYTGPNPPVFTNGVTPIGGTFQKAA